MASLRFKKIESVIVREISEMLTKKEIKDPRIGFVTVLRAEVAPDLKTGKVFVSILGGKKKTQSALTGLNNAKGYIQGKIGDRYRFRYTPVLHFLEDPGFIHLCDIHEIIQKIHKEKPYVEENQENTAEE